MNIISWVWVFLFVLLKLKYNIQVVKYVKIESQVCGSVNIYICIRLFTTITQIKI